jgi:formylglycine-generating enzyme required for sulfatase activity/tRNA A-37 threonylcarbamoyl transferase component Bud32
VSRLPAGTVLGGDFEIAGLIGEGGMGSVYEARQRSTGATRAIKVMRADLAKGEQFRRRFELEARVASRIESDHVVEVIAAGVDEPSGMPWMAMERLRGEDMSRAIGRKGPLDAGLAAELFAQLGHALAAAHRAGVVHRDLKPENIFLAEPLNATRSLQVKILDFGIAKLLGGAQATATGALGTPMWMAPEQAMSRAQLTAATDVWPLGLIAFCALTGRPFWRAANDEEGTPLQLLREITSDPIEPASARAHALGAELPEGFDAWFARCVARDPAERFADAAEAVPPLVALLKKAAGITDRVPAAVAAEVARGGTPLAYHPTEPVSPSRGTGTSFGKTDTKPLTSAKSPPVPAPWRRSTVAVAAVVLSGLAVLVWLLQWRRPSSRASQAPVSSRESQPASSPTGPLVAAPASPAVTAPLVAAIDHALSAPMVEIPGDLFLMGSTQGATDERPPQTQSVASFAIDRTEVTAADYFACVDDGKCAPPAPGPRCSDRTTPDRPMNCVTFTQASAYCAWARKRLPSEAEWELAARDRTTGRYPWGSAPPRDQLCWSATSDGGPCDVGRFAAGSTPHGLADMAGNVWEWTTGYYCPYDHPSCGDSRRVLRGGAWSSADPRLVTVSVRMESFESNQSASIGLRCARSL